MWLHRDQQHRNFCCRIMAPFRIFSASWETLSGNPPLQLSFTRVCRIGRLLRPPHQYSMQRAALEMHINLPRGGGAAWMR